MQTLLDVVQSAFISNNKCFNYLIYGRIQGFKSQSGTNFDNLPHQYGSSVLDGILTCIVWYCQKNQQKYNIDQCWTI